MAPPVVTDSMLNEALEIAAELDKDERVIIEHVVSLASSLQTYIEQTRAALTVQCCHITGEHNPRHFEDKLYVCQFQQADAFARARVVLGMGGPTVDEATSSPTCFWCNRKAAREMES